MYFYEQINFDIYMRFVCFFFLLCFFLKTEKCYSAKLLKVSTERFDHQIIVKNDIDSLLKKKTIFESLKKKFCFRCKFLEKEEKRITVIFEKLKQSLLLKDTVKIIDHTNTIVTNSLIPIDLIQKKIDSLFQNFAATIDLNSDKDVSDKEINQLADKILPMVKKKIELEEAEEARQKRIKVIHQLMRNPKGIIDTLVINDTLSKKFKLQLGKRGNVFGFHPYWMKNYYMNYNFKALNTLAFYGYELDVKTGGYKTVNGWDTAKVITAAKRAGCKVVLCIFNKSKENLNVFLNNIEAQEKLLNEVSSLLKIRQADGINILFEELGKDNRDHFTRFIRLFSKKLKAINVAYELTLTIPVIDKNLNYDIEKLNPFIDRFIIDFSKKQCYGPIAPIKESNYSLDIGIDRYLNKIVPPEKFMACLTYNGIVWDYQTDYCTYEPYNTIVNDYLNQYTPVYTQNDGVRIDIVENDTDTIQQLWYDDAHTLSEKYDFILNKGLGGIGIWGLGSDNDRPELWNALIDKTMYIDTTEVEFIHPPKSLASLTLWEKIKKEISLYALLFKHPCSFNDFKDQMISDDIIDMVMGVILGLLILVAVFYMTSSKSLGDEWKQRKLFLGILIFLVILTTVTIMMYLFLHPSFTGFGPSPSGDCGETSFGTILLILSIGFIIGLLAMKLLVIPLMKPKEIP